MEEVFDNSTLTQQAHFYTSQAEESKLKGKFTQSIDRYQRAVEEFKKLLLVQNSSPSALQAIQLLIDTNQRNIQLIKSRLNPTFSETIKVEYQKTIEPFSRPYYHTEIISKMEAIVKEISNDVAELSVSNTNAFSLVNENEDLKRKIAQFQASFNLKVQLLSDLLSSFSQVPPTEQEIAALKSNKNANVQDVSKYEKKIALLTKQLEAEASLREKQSQIIEQQKQRIKVFKEMSRQESHAFPSTATPK